MPKIYVSAPTGAFDDAGRQGLAADLTELGIRCEKLADTAFVRSTVWVYFHEHPPGTVFSGGEPAASKIVSLVAYTLRGGLDGDALKQFIAGATAAIGRRAGLSGRIPAYVVVREVEPQHWGIFGAEGSLDAMRAGSGGPPV